MMITQQKQLGKDDFRKFGLIIGIMIAVIFGLFFPWLLTYDVPLWPWIITGTFWAWAIVIPATLKPVYYAWMIIGRRLEWLNTYIVLGILFYVVFLPMGLLLKLAGKDPMTRKIYKNVNSYRMQSNTSSKEHVERPF